MGISQMETNLVSHLLDLVDDADRNKDGKIDYDEWKLMGKCSFSTEITVY